jgi:leucyl aminopeptidase (aminopeptidase T)
MFSNPTNAPYLDHGAQVLVSDSMAVKPGESVLITADTETDPAAVHALFRAVRAAGATVSVLAFPQLPYQGALADPYLPPALGPAAAHSDVWIDLAFPYVAGSHTFEEVNAAKRTRYLLAGDIGAGGISRIYGGVGADDFFSVTGTMQKLVDESTGKTMRITDPAGTDIVFKVGKPGFMKPRRAEEPGMYFVPGGCTIFPELETVCGTIALAAVFHEYYATLAEPLVLTVDDKIRDVRGPAHHRVVLDRALRRAGNGEYGNIIHLTYGMHPAARMTGQSFIEDIRVLGNNAVGMGLPFWVPGGGENHPDGVVVNQSIWLDGEQIVNDSVIIGPASIAEQARRLLPAVPASQPTFRGAAKPA